MTQPREEVVITALRVDAPARRRELTELADAVGARLAFLQADEPSLTRVLHELADAGTTRVRLVAAPGEHGKPGRSWLRRVAGDVVRDRPELRVSLGSGDVSGDEAPLHSPAWEHVPGHRSHVLVCRGPRCAARGAEAVATGLSEALRERSLGDDVVLVTQTGCLFPCNHAPVVVLHPDDAWFGGVDATLVHEVVDRIGTGPAHRWSALATGQRLPRQASEPLTP